jgi:hypothetical protein
MILAGTKTWEMRTAPCPHMGRIGLIRQGTGLIVGIADVVASLPPLDGTGLIATRNRHGIAAEQDTQVLQARWLHPWVLENVHPLSRPVPAGQKPGQVIWVTLSPSVLGTVDAQLVNPQKFVSPTRPTLTTQYPRKGGVSPDVHVGASQTLPKLNAQNVDEIIIELTAGAIKNGNICVRAALSWLPANVLGGSNKSAAAASSLTVVFRPRQTVETDIASDKMLLRCRGAVLDFFMRSGARPGDHVRIRRVALQTLFVECER